MHLTARVAPYVVLAAALGACRPAVAVDVPGADLERGRLAMAEYGCHSCHVIPGVRYAEGAAGPPLDGYGARTFIAGSLVNTPANLAKWIADPREIEPGTTMPDVGVPPELALDMAAYLLTLEPDREWRWARWLRLPRDD